MSIQTSIEEWEKVHQSMDWGAWPSIDVVRFVSRKYPGNQNEQYKILDFGCGTGANTWFFAKKGFTCYAFDCSETAIKKADQKLSLEPVTGTIHFSVADGGELAYEDNFFDCVVDNFCIYINTLERIEHIYHDLFRMIKPGGYLYTTMFTTRTTGYQSGTELEKNTYENITEGPLSGRGLALFYESPEEITGILSKAGFSDIVIDTTLYTDRGNTVEYYMVSCVKPI